MHLIIDGYGGDYHKMQDEGLLRDLLDTYPAVLGMTKIAPPHVLRYVDSKPEDWGISGFVLIAESHISIHTFPERSYINIDVFTCKSFDADRAIKDMVEAFSLQRIETRLIERGIEYPHSIERAIPVADSERREVAAAAGSGR